MTPDQQTLKLQWVSGDGGPLILMEERLLPYWEGSDAPSNGRIVEAESRWGLNVATDYDLACDVQGWAGVIRVHDGNALVLSASGDAMATWVSEFEGVEGVVVEWEYADSEEGLIAAVKELLGAGESSATNEMYIKESPIVLFVAAERGDEDMYGRQAIHIPTGKYSVTTARRATETTSVVCHIFRSQEQL